jgi:type IV pilus assembly protein PilX
MIRECMPKPARQRGAILFIALILLLVMTLLILASVRGTVMQERMASNLYDRSLAFQAAEAALREAERWLLTNRPKPPVGACDGNGTCGKPVAGMVPVWLDEDNWQEAHSVNDNHGHLIQLGDRVVAPRFIVELLADDVREDNICESTAIDPDAPCFSGPAGLRYRITARSGGERRAVVMLQSIYAVPRPAGW